MSTLGTALVELLEGYGVDTVFGIPGVHTVELYRGLAQSRIRHVTPRHEQGAGFMADGYARVTGKAGVCFLITGPGVTNAATALAEAYSDSIPVLAISSVNRTNELGMGTGRLHELPNQRGMTSSFTVFSHTILDPNELPEVLARAFVAFESGRPGPVHIEIPIDVIAGPPPARMPARMRGVARPGPDPRSVAEAVKLLAGAENPVAVFGGGAVDAGTEATALAERLDMPVLTTIAGKGVVPEHHPLSAGASMPFPKAMDMMRDADVALVVGTELAETDFLYTGKFPSFNGRVVRVDIEPSQLVRHGPPTVPMYADASLALRAILDGLDDTLPARSVPGDQRARLVRESLADCWLPVAATHLPVLDALAEAMADDGIVVCDSTQLAYTACHYHASRQARSYLFPLGFGTLGYGIPAAIGAKLGRPHRQVVCLVGDGGALFTLTELAAAVQEQVPVTIIVWNNEGYGEIRDAMIGSGVTPEGVDLTSPDFVTLAKGFGCHGEQPTSLAALRDALAASWERTVPTVIQVDQHADFLPTV